MASMQMCRLVAVVLPMLPHQLLAQVAAAPTPQSEATAKACATLGTDIQKLAESIVVDTTSDSWRRQTMEWMIDSLSRSFADEVLAGERSSGRTSDYVSAYKGSRDIVELHITEIDQIIRQFEPKLREEIADKVCSRLSADDIRSIAAFMDTPAGQRYRALRLDPALAPENLPMFVAMVHSVSDTAHKW